jgi:hypothetical protein
MPEIPPVQPPRDLPKPPPQPLEKPPVDHAALVAAYPVQVPGTADKKVDSGRDPVASNVDAGKGVLAQAANDLWGKASNLARDTAKGLGEDIARVQDSLKPGGAVFEAADRIVNPNSNANPNSNEHPVQAAVMDNLGKRGERLVEGVKDRLKAEGDHLGNLAYYAIHRDDFGAADKLKAEVDHRIMAPAQEAEGMLKGAGQLVENVGKAAGDLAYYSMHADEKVAPAKIANAVTDIALDGPQLVLAVDGASALGKGLAVGTSRAGLSEAETASAVERAYKVEPTKIDPPKAGEVPPEIAEAKAANDNAIPGAEAKEHALAATGTDGVPVGDQPKLSVIEGGAADPNAPRAMASHGEGNRRSGDRPWPGTVSAESVAGRERPSQGRVDEPNNVPARADDELARLIKEQKADMDAESRGETGLDPSGTESLPDETIHDGPEAGKIPELDSRERHRPDPERMQQGTDFDRAQRGVYTADQLELTNGKIVDSYTPNDVIVSRKHSQLAEINPAVAEGYVHEILDKYAPGNIIADTPANNARYPGLVGHRLEGKMVLEVPVQQTPIPQEFGDWSARLGVTIRDFNGQVLNDVQPR